MKYRLVQRGNRMYVTQVRRWWGWANLRWFENEFLAEADLRAHIAYLNAATSGDIVLLEVEG